jgi:hypothetical protein
MKNAVVPLLAGRPTPQLYEVVAVQERKVS